MRFDGHSLLTSSQRIGAWAFACAFMAVASGCWAPLTYCGIPCSELPDSFRTPTRANAPRINYADLTITPPRDYTIQPGDLIEVTVMHLMRANEAEPIQLTVSGDGTVQVPLAGVVKVGGLSTGAAQAAIDKALDGIIVSPRSLVKVVTRGGVSIVVLGEVQRPGAYPLANFENDVAHAIANAGGTNDVAADRIEIHRKDGGHRTGGLKLPLPPQPLERQDPPQPLKRGVLGVSKEPRTASSATVAITSNFDAHKDRLVFHATPKINGQYDNESGVLRLTGDATLKEYESALRSVSYETADDDLIESGREVNFDVKVETNAPYEADRAAPAGSGTSTSAQPNEVIQIPVRAYPQQPGLGDHADVVILPGQRFTEADITLQAGDVVYIPRRTDEVFYVVGLLNFELQSRFSIRERDREFGQGFLLPRDRDVDVVQAVCMAGYIHPIESPTTVTLQRKAPDGTTMLVIVDLIKARYDRTETMLLQPGDIVYINPDACWWFRRTWDRIVPNFFRVTAGSTSFTL